MHTLNGPDNKTELARSNTTRDWPAITAKAEICLWSNFLQTVSLTGSNYIYLKLLNHNHNFNLVDVSTPNRKSSSELTLVPVLAATGKGSIKNRNKSQF